MMPCSSTRHFPAVKSRIWASISPSSAMRNVTIYLNACARVTSLVRGNLLCKIAYILAGSSSFSIYVISRPEMVGSSMALAFAAFTSHALSSVLYCRLSSSLAEASRSFGLTSFSVTSRTFWWRRMARTCLNQKLLKLCATKVLDCSSSN